MAKVVDSPARFGGEDCDLEPDEREEYCKTDCCPGELANTRHYRAHSCNFFPTVPVKCDEGKTNSSCSASCGPGTMTVTNVQRTTNWKGCDECSTTYPKVNCNNQDCPPGRIKYIFTIVPNYSEDCEAQISSTPSGPCSVGCRRNVTLYYTKITTAAKHGGKECVNGTRGQEDCTEAPCIIKVA